MKVFLALGFLCLLSVCTNAETPYRVDWTRQFGTSRDDVGTSIVVDSGGNLFVSGYTRGNFSGTSAGESDTFLRKYDSLGNELWTKQFGTNGSDEGMDIAIDAAGSLYITGTTSGSLGGMNAGELDAYLMKYDNSGTELWKQQIGTSVSDESRSLAVDKDGNAYISGSTIGNLAGTNSGSRDAFLVKYNGSGTELWRRQLGTGSLDDSLAVAVDGSGDAYISGFTLGSLEGTNAGGVDAFLVKYDSTGTELWRRQLGTKQNDTSFCVAVDGSGNAYISGNTGGRLAGVGIRDPNGDAFLVKYDSLGNELWRRQFGTDAGETAYSLAVDGAGNLFVSGFTNGSFAGTDGASDNPFFTDVFLSKYDPSGTQLWTRQFGTSVRDRSLAVAVWKGSAYISGLTDGDFGGTNAGETDAFVMKLSVPETGTASLFLIGGVILLRMRRRISQARAANSDN